MDRENFPPINLYQRFVLLGCLTIYHFWKDHEKGLGGQSHPDVNFSLWPGPAVNDVAHVPVINPWSQASPLRTKASPLGSYLELSQAPCKLSYFSCYFETWKKHLFQYKDTKIPGYKINVLLTLREA